MKRTPDELLTQVKTVLGDRTDDDALALIEDVKDSVTPDGENWEEKYKELDKTWREKYKARFFEGGTEKDKEDEDNDGNNGDNADLKTSYDELFTEEK